MAAFYMDSSGLVKHYLPETGSVWVSSLIDATTISGEWQNAVLNVTRCAAMMPFIWPRL